MMSLNSATHANVKMSIPVGLILQPVMMSMGLEDRTVIENLASVEGVT